MSHLRPITVRERDSIWAALAEDPVKTVAIRFGRAERTIYHFHSERRRLGLPVYQPIGRQQAYFRGVAKREGENDHAAR